MGNAEAQRGYSRDHRGDHKQVLVGLAVNREGFPLAHEVFAGNRHDSTTLEDMLGALDKRVGLRPEEMVVVDRGMADAKNIDQIRAANCIIWWPSPTLSVPSGAKSFRIAAGSWQSNGNPRRESRTAEVDDPSKDAAGRQRDARALREGWAETEGPGDSGTPREAAAGRLGEAKEARDEGHGERHQAGGSARVDGTAERTLPACGSLLSDGVRRGEKTKESDNPFTIAKMRKLG